MAGSATESISPHSGMHSPANEDFSDRLAGNAEKCSRLTSNEPDASISAGEWRRWRDASGCNFGKLVFSHFFRPRKLIFFQKKLESHVRYISAVAVSRVNSAIWDWLMAYQPCRSFWFIMFLMCVARGTSRRCLFLAFARLVRRKDVSRNLHEAAAHSSWLSCKTESTAQASYLLVVTGPDVMLQKASTSSCSWKSAAKISLCVAACVSGASLVSSCNKRAKKERKKSSRRGLRTSLSSFFFIVLCIKFMGRQIENIIAFCSGITQASQPACIRNFPRRRLPCSCKLPFSDKKWAWWEWEWGLKGCEPEATGSVTLAFLERRFHELSEIRCRFNVNSQSGIASSVSFFYDHNNIRRKWPEK